MEKLFFFKNYRYGYSNWIWFWCCLQLCTVFQQVEMTTSRNENCISTSLNRKLLLKLHLKLLSMESDIKLNEARETPIIAFSFSFLINFEASSKVSWWTFAKFVHISSLCKNISTERTVKFMKVNNFRIRSTLTVPTKANFSIPTRILFFINDTGNRKVFFVWGNKHIRIIPILYPRPSLTRVNICAEHCCVLSW